MIPFINILKFAYLQRVRSYAFLITACITVAVAYTFVPAPTAGYSTISIESYQGVYNSAWFGYVTAIMTSCFLSLIGFYLVNDSIQKDIETKVGQIVSTTNIGNFSYLLSKALTNFMILLTIVVIVFFTSIVLFLSYNNAYPFELMQFVKPYALITIPAMFIIAVIALAFEVLFGKYTVIQNVAFFFLFAFFLVLPAENEMQSCIDPFGSRIVTNKMVETVQDHLGTDEELSLNIGYVIGHPNGANKFDFLGIDFPNLFIISRLFWLLFSVGLVAVFAPFFHRFNLTERQSIKQKTARYIQETPLNEVVLSKLSKIDIDYRVLPLVKTELLLIIRQTNRWVWLLNTVGFIGLAVLPLEIAHQMVLPILWFLQVGWLSRITAKEVLHNMHLFAFSSYQPIGRLLVSQLLTALLILCFLAAPLLLRLLIASSFLPMISIVLGGFFIVLLAATLGIVTKGKKLFEVLFFLIAYANINAVWFVDYFGGLRNDITYNITLLGFVFFLAVISFVVKRSRILHGN